MIFYLKNICKLPQKFVCFFGGYKCFGCIWFFALFVVGIITSCADLQKEECLIRKISSQEAFEALNYKEKSEHKYTEDNFRIHVEYLDCGYQFVVEKKDERSLERITVFILDEKLRVIHYY
ncbi:hypothetical protein [Vandammella animalimorsus]|uniref:hypothetical protein n=1 Tax=Vandammella animalimorsus TaxID=2029117 RepID=UPI0011C37AE4|nr:hypothetical protein [Vandammella animalimorsus]